MSSLFEKIKSKYILQNILSLAYKDMKSLVKLIKYNKNFLEKFNINFKNIADNYKYEKKLQKNKEMKKTNNIFMIEDIILSILLFIYMILFYIRGTIKENNLEKGYNEIQKKYIDIMDKYISLSYIIYLIISNIIYYLLIRNEKFYCKGITKWYFMFFNLFIKIAHFILYLMKFVYEKILININIVNAFDDAKQYWFYIIDLIVIFSYCFFFIFIGYNIYQSFLNHNLNYYDDGKTFKLYQFKGINILKFYLPDEFDDLNKIEQYKYILKKNNIEKYKYELNESQIDLIIKINNIRKKSKLPLLKYNSVEKIPEFIINEKKELFFYEFKNIYKLSQNSYVFKYPTKKFINLLYNTEILNIITNSILDIINIIEKDNLDYIHIYSNNPNPIIIRYNNPSNNTNQLNNKNDIIEINGNISNITINKSRNNIKIRVIENDIANTNDK